MLCTAWNLNNNRALSLKFSLETEKIQRLKLLNSSNVINLDLGNTDNKAISFTPENEFH